MNAPYHRQIILTLDVKDIMDEQELNELKEEIHQLVEQHIADNHNIVDSHIRIN